MTAPQNEHENELLPKSTTLEVLRHVLHTYGLDDPAVPLANVQKELSALIAVMEMYE